MLTRNLRITFGLFSVGALAMYAGCASSHRETSATPEHGPDRPDSTPPVAAADWPANPVADGCYEKVFVPAKLGTLAERVCTREASERIEITPARYEWVEERVMVKDASVELVEVPAEFRSQDRVFDVEPGQTGWVMKSCTESAGQPARDVFCFVRTAPVQKTVQTHCLVTASGTREVAVPAEYQTIRRQRLAAAATTRKITVPAEYQTVDRAVVLAPGRMEWQRVMCEGATTVGTANAVKGALLAAGYNPGPMNGELGAQDWSALKAYQSDNGLGVGALSYETLDKLQVAAK